MLAGRLTQLVGGETILANRALVNTFVSVAVAEVLARANACANPVLVILEDA